MAAIAAIIDGDDKATRLMAGDVFDICIVLRIVGQAPLFRDSNIVSFHR